MRMLAVTSLARSTLAPEVPSIAEQGVPGFEAVLRYALVIDQGGGGAPEEVVLSDRVLQVVGLIWLLSFALGIHG